MRPHDKAVGTTDIQTLTNKSIDGNLNTFTNVPIGALPATVVTTTGTQTLTNKSISGSTNTLTNVPASALTYSAGDIGSYLQSTDTTQQDGAASSNFVYATASITLTPGTWIVQATACLVNLTTADDATVGIWNNTASAEVAGSRGGAFTSSTTVMVGPASLPTKMVIGSNTVVKPYCCRNGGSTIRATTTNSAGGPAAAITAWRIQ